MRIRIGRSRTGSVAYLVTHPSTGSSLSTGMGQLRVDQFSALSLKQMAAHMSKRPNDVLMQRSLMWKVIDPRDSMLPQVIELYKKGPSIALTGALAEAHPKAFPAAAEALARAGNDRVNRLLGRNCLVSTRAKTLGSDVESFLKSWDRVMRYNRDNHVPMEYAWADELVVPQELMPTGQRRYVPLSDIAAAASGKKAFRTGTSLRVIDPSETLKRIAPIFRRIEGKGPVRVRSDNGCWWAFVKWTEAMKFTNGRNKYQAVEYTTPTGKGVTRDAATASVKMELIERHSAFVGSESNWPACYVRDLSLKHARYSDLKQKGTSALDPNDFDLPYPYENQPLHWVKGEAVTAEGLKPVYAPAQRVFGRSNFDEPQVFYVTANGLASGNTLDEAKLHALCELFERDGQYSVFYSPKRCFVLGGHHGAISNIVKQYEARGLKLRLMDISTEFGVPAYTAFLKIGDTVMNGFGAHLDGKIAAMRAIGELNCQFSSYMTGRKDNPADKPIPGEKTMDFDDLPNYSTGNVQEDLKILERLAVANGLSLTYVDLTRKSMRIPVVRAIMPGFEVPYRINGRQIEHLLEFQKRNKQPA